MKNLIDMTDDELEQEYIDYSVDTSILWDEADASADVKYFREIQEEMENRGLFD